MIRIYNPDHNFTLPKPSILCLSFKNSLSIKLHSFFFRIKFALWQIHISALWNVHSRFPQESVLAFLQWDSFWLTLGLICSLSLSGSGLKHALMNGQIGGGCEGIFSIAHILLCRRSWAPCVTNGRLLDLSVPWFIISNVVMRLRAIFLDCWQNQRQMII
jgi:hypothetical protein